MCLLAAGCAKEIKLHAASNAEAASQSPQAQVISAFTLAGHTESGRKKWEVEGETADVTTDLVALSPVTAKSFGKTELVLTADRGRFHRNNRNIELEDDVVATTSDGARLMTDSFQWKADREIGITEDWVAVTRPGMVMRGLGCLTYPRLKRVRFQRDVFLIIDGKEGKTFVTCDGRMEVDYGRRKARFWRNVEVRDAKGTLKADRMDVELHPQRNDVTQVHCWGHVEIYDHEKKKSAFCSRADSWRGIGRTLLFGHPKLALLADNES